MNGRGGRRRGRFNLGLIAGRERLVKLFKQRLFHLGFLRGRGRLFNLRFLDVFFDENRLGRLDLRRRGGFRRCGFNRLVHDNNFFFGLNRLGDGFGLFMRQRGRGLRIGRGRFRAGQHVAQINHHFLDRLAQFNGRGGFFRRRHDDIQFMQAGIGFFADLDFHGIGGLRRGGFRRAFRLRRDGRDMLNMAFRFFDQLLFLLAGDMPDAEITQQQDGQKIERQRDEQQRALQRR